MTVARCEYGGRAVGRFFVKKDWVLLGMHRPEQSRFDQKAVLTRKKWRFDQKILLTTKHGKVRRENIMVCLTRRNEELPSLCFWFRGNKTH